MEKKSKQPKKSQERFLKRKKIRINREKTVETF